MTTAPHPVPEACLEQDIATVAQKGAGKSYLNRGLAERLLARGSRVIIMDPLNSWWGLQATADGKPGFAITVIGGPNADLPLDPARGTELGAFLAKSAMSVVLDVSDLTRSQLIRFATDFLAELYRVNRDALWLILEEADVFAPQNPSTDGTRGMHDVVDQIARRGRARGFRLWSITQRPARLSKDILTQASTLCLLRIRSPQDRAAAEEWIKGHADKAEAARISGSLAGLAVGEGYVWAPDLDLLERVRFPRIRTLDTSKTPKDGDVRPDHVTLAKPNLGALEALLTKPKEAAIVAPTARTAPAVDVDAIRRQAFEDAKAELQRGLEALGAQVAPDLQALMEAAQQVNAQAEKLMERVAARLKLHLQGAATTATSQAAVAPPRRARPPAPPRAPDDPPDLAGDRLSGPQQALLDQLLWTEATLKRNSAERTMLALLAGVSPTSGTFAGNLSQLKAGGLIAYPETGKVALTIEGRAKATPTSKARTNGDLQAVVLGRLNDAQRAIVKVLIGLHPTDASREAVASSVGVSPTSGTFAGNLSVLKSLGLIDYPDRGRVVAADVLFPLPA